MSVVVPLYNSAQTMARCVDSLRAQTLADLEILLVDDGSTDETAALADACAQADPRIRVIRKQNGGPASARNAGIEAAKGQYIGFVDADDYVEAEMFASLLGAACAENADVVQCRCVTEKEGRQVREGGASAVRVLIGADVFFYFYAQKAVAGQTEGPADYDEAKIDCFSPYSCDKLYRRTCIGAVRYTEEMRTLEDIHFLFRLTKGARKAVFLDSYLYHRTVNADSVSNASTPAAIRKLLDALLVMERDEKPFAPEAWPHRYFLLVHLWLSAAYRYYASSERGTPEGGALLAEIRANLRRLKADPCWQYVDGNHKKLAFLLLRLRPAAGLVFSAYRRADRVRSRDRAKTV